MMTSMEHQETSYLDQPISLNIYIKYYLKEEIQMGTNP